MYSSGKILLLVTHSSRG